MAQWIEHQTSNQLRGHGVVVSELGSSASLEGGAGLIPAGGSFSLFENCQVSVRVQFRKKVIPEQCQEQEKSPSDFQLFPQVGFRKPAGGPQSVMVVSMIVRAAIPPKLLRWTHNPNAAGWKPDSGTFS